MAEVAVLSPASNDSASSTESHICNEDLLSDCEAFTNETCERLDQLIILFWNRNLADLPPNRIANAARALDTLANDIQSLSAVLHAQRDAQVRVTTELEPDTEPDTCDAEDNVQLQIEPETTIGDEDSLDLVSNLLATTNRSQLQLQALSITTPTPSTPATPRNFHQLHRPVAATPLARHSNRNSDMPLTPCLERLGLSEATRAMISFKQPLGPSTVANIQTPKLPDSALKSLAKCHKAATAAAATATHSQRPHSVFSNQPDSPGLKSPQMPKFSTRLPFNSPHKPAATEIMPPSPQPLSVHVTQTYSFSQLADFEATKSHLRPQALAYNVPESETGTQAQSPATITPPQLEALTQTQLDSLPTFLKAVKLEAINDAIQQLNVSIDCEGIVDVADFQSAAVTRQALTLTLTQLKLIASRGGTRYVLVKL